MSDADVVLKLRDKKIAVKMNMTAI